MPIIRLSKEFTFDMAHALFNYDGLCRNIHGHTYTLRVTIKGEPIHDPDDPKNGMLMDFKDLKSILNEVLQPLDHALMLNDAAPEDVKAVLKSNYENIVLVEYQPTTENMIIDLAGKIASMLPQNISLHSLLLRETPSSFAEWYAEDQK